MINRKPMLMDQKKDEKLVDGSTKEEDDETCGAKLWGGGGLLSGRRLAGNGRWRQWKVGRADDGVIEDGDG